MGAVLVIRDISDQMRIEEELLKRDEMLQLINKIMRHDIRNRLSIAFGFLGLLRESKTLDEMMLLKAYDAVGKAIGITKRMGELESLTMNGNEMEPVDLKMIIEVLDSEIDIEMDLDGDCRVRADRALSSVFENLINNSIVHGKADTVRISAREHGGNCIVMYSDNGEGIPERLLPQIFEEGISFGPRKGSGLGLFIVKRTIERYGGTISVGSNEPRGIFFRITLPSWNQDNIDK
jgi:signal transduction histidine kinase